MSGKDAHKNPAFKKALAKFQSKWPGVVIQARDRVKWNLAMKKTNKRARLKQKRKKKVAT